MSIGAKLDFKNDKGEIVNNMIFNADELKKVINAFIAELVIKN